jgi:hypothetical protein
MSKKYASKSEAWVVGIRGDVFAYVTLPDGKVVQRVEKEALILEFKPLISHGTTYDRMVAAKTFFPNTGWRLGDTTERSGHKMMGAIPSTHPQPMYNSGNNNFEGMTAPYDPTMHFGFYDTAWLPDAALRAEAEAGLDGHALRGVEFVEVEAETLTPPWPSYDKIGQGAVAKIPSMVRDLELDPMSVISYEVATKNREGVVKALTELLETQQSDAIDEASLSRSL